MASWKVAFNLSDWGGRARHCSETVTAEVRLVVLAMQGFCSGHPLLVARDVVERQSLEKDRTFQIVFIAGF